MMTSLKTNALIFTIVLAASGSVPTASAQFPEGVYTVFGRVSDPDRGTISFSFFDKTAGKRRYFYFEGRTTESDANACVAKLEELEASTTGKSGVKIVHDTASKSTEGVLMQRFYSCTTVSL